MFTFLHNRICKTYIDKYRFNEPITSSSHLIWSQQIGSDVARLRSSMIENKNIKMPKERNEATKQSTASGLPPIFAKVINIFAVFGATALSNIKNKRWVAYKLFLFGQFSLQGQSNINVSRRLVPRSHASACEICQETTSWAWMHPVGIFSRRWFPLEIYGLCGKCNKLKMLKNTNIDSGNVRPVSLQQKRICKNHIEPITTHENVAKFNTWISQLVNCCLGCVFAEHSWSTRVLKKFESWHKIFYSLCY